MEERDITNVTLRWKTQSDGKVFHREEETAVCQEDDACATV